MSAESNSATASDDLNSFLLKLHDSIKQFENLKLNDRLNQLENNSYVKSTAVKSSPKIPLPEKFDGNISKYRDFLASVKNYFALQGNRYPDEETKVRFIGTLFTGDPLTWFRSLIESDSDVLSDYQMFLLEFKNNYDDPYVMKNSQSKIRRLKQGKGSVLVYSARFRRLAAETGYNNEAKIALFRTGLNDDVKDVLATLLEEPSEFESFMNFCVKIDHRLFDRKMEKRGFSQSNFHFKRTSETSEPSPMDLDNISSIASSSVHERPLVDLVIARRRQNIVENPKRLSKEERNRRFKENLCLYCGESGHRLSNCPKKSKN